MDTAKFESKIENYIARMNLVEDGDRVAVGISGGADSVCLLRVLADMAKKSGGRFQVSAIHVNHNLRGRASHADEQFVRELCEKLSIQLHVFSYSVQTIAKEKKLGLEEAGRMARYDAFRDCIRNYGVTKIALAHHANDLAETFLFRASRGSSVQGMAGIRPLQKIHYGVASLTREGNRLLENPQEWTEENVEEIQRLHIHVIHPLLTVTRPEIERYLTARGQDWKKDSTNDNDAYTRNKIRHRVIPFLEENVNTRTVVHIAEMAEDFAEADVFLRDEAKRRGRDLLLQTPASIMIDNALTDQPEILQGYILLNAMELLTDSRKDLGKEQIRQIQKLFSLPSGSRVDLPYHMKAVRDYDGVTLMYSYEDTEAGKAGNAAEVVEITGGGVYFFEDWKITADFVEVPNPDQLALEDMTYTKLLDYDKIKNNLVIRKRLPGDRLTVNAEGGTKRLKDYLIDQKVPQRDRNNIPVLASEDKVCWVIGYRISEDCKITKGTRHVLRIQAEKLE